MQHQTGNFAVDEHTIHYQRWMPEQPIAALLICHGIGEHSGRYQRFAEFFVQHGYAIYSFDHIGHGLSSGFRGHLNSREPIMQCIESMRQLIEEQLGETRIVLLGHSMGGLMSAAYISQFQQHIAGCVLSAPAIASDAKPPQWLIACIKWLARLFPRFGLIKLDPNGLNTDAEEVEAYLNDPLNLNSKIDLATIITLDDTQDYALSNAKAVELPLFIQHAEDDPVTSANGSRQYLDGVSSKHKQMMAYPNMLHEIYNEPKRELVFNDLLAWLSKLLDD